MGAQDWTAISGLDCYTVSGLDCYIRIGLLYRIRIGLLYQDWTAIPYQDWTARGGRNQDWTANGGCGIQPTVHALASLGVAVTWGCCNFLCQAATCCCLWLVFCLPLLPLLLWQSHYCLLLLLLPELPFAAPRACHAGGRRFPNRVLQPSSPTRSGTCHSTAQTAFRLHSTALACSIALAACMESCKTKSYCFRLWIGSA